MAAATLSRTRRDTTRTCYPGGDQRTLETNVFNDVNEISIAVELISSAVPNLKNEIFSPCGIALVVQPGRRALLRAVRANDNQQATHGEQNQPNCDHV